MDFWRLVCPPGIGWGLTSSKMGQYHYHHHHQALPKIVQCDLIYFYYILRMGFVKKNLIPHLWTSQSYGKGGLSSLKILVDGAHTASFTMITFSESQRDASVRPPWQWSCPQGPQWSSPHSNGKQDSGLHWNDWTSSFCHIRHCHGGKLLRQPSPGELPCYMFTHFKQNFLWFSSPGHIPWATRRRQSPQNQWRQRRSKEEDRPWWLHLWTTPSLLQQVSPCSEL